MRFSIRLLYLYLFSAIGLLIGVVGIIRIVDLGLKIYVFNNADLYTISRPMLSPDGPKSMYSPEEALSLEIQQQEENRRQRRREVAGSLAMIIVGTPLYFYHWHLIRKEA